MRRVREKTMECSCWDSQKKEENSQAIVTIAILSDILVLESRNDSFFFSHSFTAMLLAAQFCGDLEQN